MSSVTTLLLHVGFEDRGKVDEVNAQLAELGGRHENGTPRWSLLDVTEPLVAWGGGKHPERLWGGGLNGFSLPAFARVLAGIRWADRDAVQVIVHQEHGNQRFEVYNLDGLAALLAAHEALYGDYGLS